MKKGFTLIELLVVIAVIGLLAGIVLVSVNNARLKGRDSRRKADLRQISYALEAYYTANDSTYPQAGSCDYGDMGCYVQSTAGPNWIPALTSGGYMTTVPMDPINNTNNPWEAGHYVYSYGNVTSDGQAFDLTAQLENTADIDRCGVKCFKFWSDNHYWCTACGGNYSNQIYESSPLTP